MRDLGIAALGIVLAVVLVRTGVLREVLASTVQFRFLASFLAGLFFVSMFTAAPASALIIEIAKDYPPLLLGFFGGLGALVGDWLIFRFVRDELSRGLLRFLRNLVAQQHGSFFGIKLLRVLMVIVGAIIVASPFPDEGGLMLMGLSGVRTLVFVPLSFSLNFLGIFAFALLVRGMG